MENILLTLLKIVKEERKILKHSQKPQTPEFVMIVNVITRKTKQMTKKVRSIHKRLPLHGSIACRRFHRFP